MDKIEIMQTPKAIFILFIAMLLLPTADSLWSLDPFSRHNENRKLAERPSLSFSELKKFPAKFQTYFNDNFGFRNTLVRGNYFLKYRLLGASPSSQVIIGKKGWLFYTGEGEVEDCRGVTDFTDEQLQRWTMNFELKKTWLAAQGIRYLLVIPPNKSTVYPEYLPDALTRVQPVSGVNEFIDYVKKNSQVELVDLRKTLADAKATGDVYFKTDTHWNNYGAFHAYAEIIKPIVSWFPEITPLKLEDFSIEKKHGASGDLAGMIGGLEFLSEDQFDLTPKKHFTATLFEKNENARDPFTMEKSNDQLPNAVIFRDSFFTAMVPFVADNFSSSRYYWQRWDTLTPITDIIDRYHPDIVIEEVVERSFKYDQNDFAKPIPSYMASDFNAGAITDIFDILKVGKEIVVNEQLVLTSNKDGLQLTASGSDPMMFLPEGPKPKDSCSRQLLNIGINSRHETTMQLFYNVLTGQAYSEARSISVSVKKGDNQLKIPLLLQGGVVGKIRLDPASAPGDYQLNRLELQTFNIAGCQ